MEERHEYLKRPLGKIGNIVVPLLFGVLILYALNSA